MTQHTDEESTVGTALIEAASTSDLNIPVDVKVGLLHTIAKAIYATPVGKVREAVANARDNKATWTVIIADRVTNSLCIYDNGHGIKQERFQEIFKSIGYGLLSADPQTKLSYFGLGLMSIFQLGDKISLFTKPPDEGKILLLKVDTKSIFDEENKGNSISELRNYITLHNIDKKVRSTISVPLVDDFLEKKLGGIPKSFTEIVIEEVKNEDLNAICDPGFVDELRKVLPLRVEPDEPFMKRFTESKGKEIKLLFENVIFCPIIDVYFGIRGSENEEIESGENNQVSKEEEIKQLWKYFPRFRSDLQFPDANIRLNVPSNGDFAYYFVHSIAQDLHRHREDTRENGFWIRNQNFLVKGADFLERPGPGRRIISPPLRHWIFGEIFHKNMNKILTVSRNEFLFDEKAFQEFRDEIVEIARPLDNILRTIWEQKNKIEATVIEPFSMIAEPGGTLEKTEQRLRHLLSDDGHEIEEKDFREKVFLRLNEKRNKEIEREEARIDRIISKDGEPILLGEEKNVLVRMDPKLDDIGQNYKVTWDTNQNRVVVSISPNLFEPKRVLFLGETFTLVYVAMTESDPGVSVDVESKIIYVNPFNKELSHYSVSILDVLIALEVADALSETQDELKRNFLSLLGARPTGVYEYVTPLGDDLRRTLTFRQPGE